MRNDANKFILICPSAPDYTQRCLVIFFNYGICQCMRFSTTPRCAVTRLRLPKLSLTLESVGYRCSAAALISQAVMAELGRQPTRYKRNGVLGRVARQDWLTLRLHEPCVNLRRVRSCYSSQWCHWYRRRRQIKYWLHANLAPKNGKFSSVIKYKLACMCFSAINVLVLLTSLNCCMSTLRLIHYAHLLTPACWKSNYNTNTDKTAHGFPRTSLALDPTMIWKFTPTIP